MKRSCGEIAPHAFAGFFASRTNCCDGLTLSIEVGYSNMELSKFDRTGFDKQEFKKGHTIKV
jgi:hypothetical protein